MIDQKQATFGIVGGFGPLAGADLFLKFVKATPAGADGEHFNVLLEQQPLRDKTAQGGADYDPGNLKLRICDMVSAMAARNVDYILLGCFISHTFINELTQAFGVPLLNMMDGLRQYVSEKHAGVKTIGILTSDYVRKKKLFEQYFNAATRTLLYPEAHVQADCLMAAVYGPEGIKAGHLGAEVTDLLQTACEHLIARGAELIIPGFTEIPVVLEDLLNRKALPVLDCNQIYANWAIRTHARSIAPKRRRIGIIGGVGPSATVDLMNKIIHNTPAQMDQEHCKMIVEHNPQIPDRTAHLLQGGQDPTIALYTSAKKLEQGEADFIVIPCNTAHAFIQRIQPRLSIPIVSMIETVAAHVAANYPKAGKVGLLATSGTVRTGIYHQAFYGSGFELITPDEDHQAMVMEAIYGEKGVKAGFTDGEAKALLLRAAAFLVNQGAKVLILGCTELPLLLDESQNYLIAGKGVAIVDPTNVLAKKCVSLAAGDPLSMSTPG